MSEYMKTYSVLEESGITLDATLAEACESIAAWINSEFSDILTANYVAGDETKGYARVEVYAKGSSKIGFYFGSQSITSTTVCAGYICNGSYLGGSGTKSADYAYFGTWSSSSYTLSKLTGSPALLKLALIKGNYGYAVDFIAPGLKDNTKKVMYVKCDDGVTMALYSDIFYVEKNGVYYAPGITLLPQSGANEKVLSRFAIPQTGILPEHLYLSDRFVGSNNPYMLNGKAYVDVLFGSGTYMGFALELS